MNKKISSLLMRKSFKVLRFESVNVVENLTELKFFIEDFYWGNCDHYIFYQWNKFRKTNVCIYYLVQLSEFDSRKPLNENLIGVLYLNMLEKSIGPLITEEREKQRDAFGIALVNVDHVHF